GPMPDFIGKALEHLGNTPTHYGTAARMKGMLTVAKEELPDFPFYSEYPVSST
ncbi:hypothetical protein C8J57DRAFT_1285829, partial [Mycena rebaudengoi]